MKQVQVVAHNLHKTTHTDLITSHHLEKHSANMAPETFLLKWSLFKGHVSIRWGGEYIFLQHPCQVPTVAPVEIQLGIVMLNGWDFRSPKNVTMMVLTGFMLGAMGFRSNI